jgi:putative flippase GtrA
LRVKQLVVLAKSISAGGAATVVDLATMALLVSACGVSARIASVPALLVAGTVNFLGNRHFAFGATGEGAARQARLFALVHLVTLTLNAVLFDFAMRAADARVPYWPIRLAVSTSVYLAWSFPMFRRIFRPRTRSSALEPR